MPAEHLLRLPMRTPVLSSFLGFLGSLGKADNLTVYSLNMSSEALTMFLFASMAVMFAS